MNSGWMGEGRGLAASGGIPAGSSPAGASGLQNAHFLTAVQGRIMLSVWREGLILSVMPAVLCRAKKGISYPSSTLRTGRVNAVTSGRTRCSGPWTGSMS
jgi:hypothetical protein